MAKGKKVDPEREKLNNARLLKSNVKEFQKFREENNYEFLDLSGQNIQGVTLTGANLSNIDFTQANIEYANLTNANLTGCKFNNAFMSYVNLSLADLSNSDLTETNLTGATLEKAILNNSNLHKANLSNCNFMKASVNEANFDETNLSLSNLSDTNLIQTKNLEKCIYDQHTIWPGTKLLPYSFKPEGNNDIDLDDLDSDNTFFTENIDPNKTFYKEEAMTPEKLKLKLMEDIEITGKGLPEIEKQQIIMDRKLDYLLTSMLTLTERSAISGDGSQGLQGAGEAGYSSGLESKLSNLEGSIQNIGTVLTKFPVKSLEETYKLTEVINNIEQTQNDISSQLKEALIALDKSRDELDNILAGRLQASYIKGLDNMFDNTATKISTAIEKTEKAIIQNSQNLELNFDDTFFSTEIARQFKQASDLLRGDVDRKLNTHGLILNDIKEGMETVKKETDIKSLMYYFENEVDNKLNDILDLSSRQKEEQEQQLNTFAKRLSVLDKKLDILSQTTSLTSLNNLIGELGASTSSEFKKQKDLLIKLNKKIEGYLDSTDLSSNLATKAIADAVNKNLQQTVSEKLGQNKADIEKVKEELLIKIQQLGYVLEQRILQQNEKFKETLNEYEPGKDKIEEDLQEIKGLSESLMEKLNQFDSLLIDENQISEIKESMETPLNNLLEEFQAHSVNVDNKLEGIKPEVITKIKTLFETLVEKLNQFDSLLIDDNQISDLKESLETPLNNLLEEFQTHSVNVDKKLEDIKPEVIEEMKPVFSEQIEALKQSLIQMENLAPETIKIKGLSSNEIIDNIRDELTGSVDDVIGKIREMEEQGLISVAREEMEHIKNEINNRSDSLRDTVEKLSENMESFMGNISNKKASLEQKVDLKIKKNDDTPDFINDLLVDFEQDINTELDSLKNMLDDLEEGLEEPAEINAEVENDPIVGAVIDKLKGQIEKAVNRTNDSLVRKISGTLEEEVLAALEKKKTAKTPEETYETIDNINQAVKEIKETIPEVNQIIIDKMNTIIEQGVQIGSNDLEEIKSEIQHNVENIDFSQHFETTVHQINNRIEVLQTDLIDMIKIIEEQLNSLTEEEKAGKLKDILEKLKDLQTENSQIAESIESSKDEISLKLYEDLSNHITETVHKHDNNLNEAYKDLKSQLDAMEIDDSLDSINDNIVNLSESSKEVDNKLDNIIDINNSINQKSETIEEKMSDLHEIEQSNADNVISKDSIEERITALEQTIIQQTKTSFDEINNLIEMEKQSIEERKQLNEQVEVLVELSENIANSSEASNSKITEIIEFSENINKKTDLLIDLGTESNSMLENIVNSTEVNNENVSDKLSTIIDLTKESSETLVTKADQTQEILVTISDKIENQNIQISTNISSEQQQIKEQIGNLIEIGEIISSTSENNADKIINLISSSETQTENVSYIASELSLLSDSINEKYDSATNNLSTIIETTNHYQNMTSEMSERVTEFSEFTQKLSRQIEEFLAESTYNDIENIVQGMRSTLEEKLQTLTDKEDLLKGFIDNIGTQMLERISEVVDQSQNLDLKMSQLNNEQQKEAIDAITQEVIQLKELSEGLHNKFENIQNYIDLQEIVSELQNEIQLNRKEIQKSSSYDEIIHTINVSLETFANKVINKSSEIQNLVENLPKEELGQELKNFDSVLNSLSGISEEMKDKIESIINKFDNIGLQNDLNALRNDIEKHVDNSLKEKEQALNELMANINAGLNKKIDNQYNANKKNMADMLKKTEETILESQAENTNNIELIKRLEGRFEHLDKAIQFINSRLNNIIEISENKLTGKEDLERLFNNFGSMTQTLDKRTKDLFDKFEETHSSDDMKVIESLKIELEKRVDTLADVANIIKYKLENEENTSLDVQFNDLRNELNNNIQTILNPVLVKTASIETKMNTIVTGDIIPQIDNLVGEIIVQLNQEVQNMSALAHTFKSNIVSLDSHVQSINNLTTDSSKKLTKIEQDIIKLPANITATGKSESEYEQSIESLIEYMQNESNRNYTLMKEIIQVTKTSNALDAIEEKLFLQDKQNPDKN